MSKEHDEGDSCKNESCNGFYLYSSMKLETCRCGITGEPCWACSNRPLTCSECYEASNE